MTWRRYSAAKVSTRSKFSASANNFRAVARQKVSVNIIIAGDPPPPPPPVYMWSWGRNDLGQLGQGNTTATSSPVQIGTDTNWSKVSDGAYQPFTVATKTDGTLWSWGNGGTGQLGLGNVTTYSSPKQVGSLTTWALAIASQNDSSFAILN